MTAPQSRRRFLGSLGGLVSAATLAPLTAGPPFSRTGPPRLALSLAAYSFRDFFVDSSHEQDKKADASKRLDMFQFISLCAEHGCQGAEVTSYYFPAAITQSYLLKLKSHAFLSGVELSGTSVGNTFTLPKGEKRDQEIRSVKTWIDYAATLGIPHIRVFAGSRGSLPHQQAKELCLEALREVVPYASQRGIVLGLENHGGIVAEAGDLLELVEAVNSPWLGINLDTANFNTEDPYADLAKCAPWAVNVQLKTELTPRGKKKELADIARILQILREARYQGYLVLEYEAAEDPWVAVPLHLKRLKALL
jgi:sugar phosphate isomerase/epimerase